MISKVYGDMRRSPFNRGGGNIPSVQLVSTLDIRLVNLRTRYWIGRRSTGSSVAWETFKIYSSIFKLWIPVFKGRRKPGSRVSHGPYEHSEIGRTFR